MEKASFYINWLNIIGIALMPVSMVTGYISILVFKQGWIAPYPSGMFHTLIFSLVFFTVLAVSFIFVKKPFSVK